MTVVVATIGTKAAENVDLSGSATGSGTIADPWVIAIDADYSANWVVGDALTDEAATPNTYLVTAVYNGGNVEVIDYFGAGTAPLSTGGSQAQLQRAHASMTAHEANLANYGATDDAEGHLYEDINEASTVTINDATPASITYLVPDGLRHDGYTTPSAGVVVTATGASGASWLTAGRSGLSFLWIDIDANDKNWIYTLTLGTNTTSMSLRHCLVHDFLGNRSTTLKLVGHQGVNATGTHARNVVFGLEQSGTGDGPNYGMDVNAGGSADLNVIGNTVAAIHHGTTGTGTATGINGKNDADLVVKNNVVADVTIAGGTGDALEYRNFGGSTVTATNMDTDGSGPDSLTATTLVFVDAANGDYHLAAGDDAVDAGTDLTTTYSGAEIDIDGRDVDSEGDTWDCGADELVAAAAGGIPAGSLALLGVGA